MKTGQHEILRAVEDGHWWYAVLHGLVRGALRRHLKQGARVLDAGCGTGGLLTKLGAYEAVGCDLSLRAVELCHARGLSTVRVADVASLPFPDGSFDAVLCLDVLYHAAVDEVAALRELRRVLRTGGLWVVNVPAFECLRGAHDVAVCGTRRYLRGNWVKKLASHGLVAETAHYWNAWLFLALWLRRRFSENEHGDLHLPPVWLNTILRVCGRMDAFLCRVLLVPFGSSVFAVGRAC